MKNIALAKSMNYGVFLGLMLIGISVIAYVAGLKTGDSINAWSGGIVMLVGVFYFMLRFRNKDNGGFASFGQLFVVGFLTLLIAIIISSVYSYVFLTYINPEAVDEIKQVTYDRYISSGMSQEEAIKSMKMAEPFMTPLFTSLMAIVIYGFVGAGLGAIYGLILKKADPNPFRELDADV
ncbi:DUF4199 domain-containing protein [bacterium SCSIO 12741]|nr:DUF4199 domain-containing protein [bacterium SCSIO 12741]